MLSSIFADTRSRGCLRDDEQARTGGQQPLQFLGHSGLDDRRRRRAENDVDILSKLSGAFRNGAPDGTLGVATIDRYGNVIAGASLDANGNLSVFGSGSSGGASSKIGMSLSSPTDGGTWYANASAELAQASYELNSLINQSTAAAGVDRAA
jgi:hypothetical protein